MSDTYYYAVPCECGEPGCHEDYVNVSEEIEQMKAVLNAAIHYYENCDEYGASIKVREELCDTVKSYLEYLNK